MLCITVDNTAHFVGTALSLKSSIGGKFTFLSVWSLNQNIESGASAFVVAPNEDGGYCRFRLINKIIT